MVLTELSIALKNKEDMFAVDRLFERFHSKHPKADRYTFLALLEVFCRYGESLDTMIEAIEFELSDYTTDDQEQQKT